MLTLKVFLSSPGDVSEERRLAVETMRNLEDSPLLRERVNLIVVAWDDPVAGSPLDARETPQASVNRWSGRPSDCDLTIAVLWGRLGTPLPPSLTRADGSRFASGTVWEVEDAIAADRPVFVYRRTEKPRIEIDDTEFDAKRAQYDAVRRWLESLRNADGSARAGINDYATPAQFQQLLRAHLEAFISRQLAGSAAELKTIVPRTVVAASPPDPKAEVSATLRDATASRVPTDADTPRRAAPTAALRWIVLAATAAVLIVAVLVWVLRPGRAPEVAVASAASAVAPNASPVSGGPASIPSGANPPKQGPPSALPRIDLGGPAALSFSTIRPSTYTILALTPEAETTASWRLRIRVRLTTAPNGGDMNFWDSSFRLLVDGVPRAPISNLNEIVASDSAKDGDVLFVVPWAVAALTLQVTHYAETADLPLVVTGTRPPEAPSLPAGPRSVALDGPAEIAFSKGPQTKYTILAIASEARRPGVFGLRVRLRMHVLDSPGANFWDSTFRLVADGAPLAPDSSLNAVVEPRAAKDGDITFEVPDAAKSLVLRIRHSADQSADVPLKLAPKP